MRKRNSYVLTGIFLGVALSAATASAQVLPPLEAGGAWDPNQHFTAMESLFESLSFDAYLLAEESRLDFPLTEQEMEELYGNPDCQFCEADSLAMRVGINIQTHIPIAFDGVQLTSLDQTGRPEAFGFMRLNDQGQLVWTAAIHSEGAGALRLRLAHVELPETADLFLYTEEREAYGPYRAGDVTASGDLWTNLAGGPIVYLELRTRTPATQNDLDNIHFVIAGIGHIRDDQLASAFTSASKIQNPATCTKDSNCYTPNDLLLIRFIERAVSLTLFTDGTERYYRACSGSLLNNTNQDTAPYFLTANHCVSTDAVADSMLFVWRFTSTACDMNYQPAQNNDYRAFPQSRGATMLRTSAATDYTLLRLKEAPPPGSVFLGWDASRDYSMAAGTTVYRISHPKFYPASYSTHTIMQPNAACASSGGRFIISTNTETGRALNGSSGSPLLLSTGVVIGQASKMCGGDDSPFANNCLSPVVIDGSLRAQFHEIQQWLAPGSDDTSGGCTIGALRPAASPPFSKGAASFCAMLLMVLVAHWAMRTSQARKPRSLRGRKNDAFVRLS